MQMVIVVFLITVMIAQVTLIFVLCVRTVSEKTTIINAQAV